MSFDPNTPAAATPADLSPSATPAPSAPVPQSTTPTASPVPATPAPSEDRSNWVPPHRLRETTSRYEQAIQAERAKFAAERADMERKLQALAGVAPPQNTEVDNIRNQFKQVFPDLDEIGANAAAIKELLALKDELRASMEHQWAAHNKSAMDRLYKSAESTYGESLTDQAKRSLGSAFIGYLQSNPDAYERYQRDPAVAEEFWQEFSERFVAPARRQAVVSQAARIPTGLPLDTPSGAVPTSAPVKAATQDERLQQALNLYKAKSNQGF